MKSATDILEPEAAARLAAFRRDLDAALPGMIRRVMLFGSRARGDAAPDSDFDVAVFVRADGAVHSETRQLIADMAFNQMIEGLELAPMALPDDFLDPVDGHYRSELARRIFAEGVDI